MDLEAVAERTHALADAAEEEQLLRAAAEAEALARELSAADELNFVCAHFVDIAGQLGCDYVAGASAVGAQLAGATVALANNGLRLYSPADDARHVLLLDVLLITGSNIRESQREIAVGSAAEVSAAVVASAFGQLDAEALGLASLKVLAND